jgi:hypothetical protein
MLLAMIFCCVYLLTGLQVAKSLTQFTTDTQWYVGWLITLGWPIVILTVVVGVCLELGSVLVKTLNNSKEARNNGTTNNV